MIANLLRRLRGTFARKPARASGQRRFDGAVVDRLTASWLATGTAIDQELRGDLDRLRARSRDLAKNNEYVVKFLRMVRNNVAGPDGFALQCRAADYSASAPNGVPDVGANRAIENAFYEWSRPGQCEVSGRFSFNGCVQAMVTSLARDGELLFRKVRGRGAGAFGFQIQLMDVARLDTTYNRAAAGGENAIVMGVEMDSVRRPVAYHILTSQGLDGSFERRRERFSAADIVHAFIPLEVEQTRGVPWVHAAMRRLNDLGGYREAAVIAARIGASKMGFYVAPDGQPPSTDGRDEQGNFIAQAAPGEFGVLPVGYDFKEFNPAYPHEQFDAFCKAALRGIAGGLGVAYNGLANDLEGVNYSSIRAGVIEERDEWMVIQGWLIDHVLQPLFYEWIEMALLAGAITLGNGSPLPATKLDKFKAHTWQGRRWQWVDPEKDITASILAIRNRLASPQQVAAQTGRDIEDVLDDMQRFEQMLRDRNLSIDPTPVTASPASAQSGNGSP